MRQKKKKKQREEKLLRGGKEGGKEVNNNRKSGWFLGVFTISLYCTLLILISTKQDIIFQPLHSTSCFPALQANDKLHLQDPKSQPEKKKKWKKKNWLDFSLSANLTLSPAQLNTATTAKRKGSVEIQRRDNAAMKPSSCHP